MNAKERFLRKDRICNRCKVRPGGKKHPWCKECQAEYYQEKIAADPNRRVELAKRAREWREANKDAFRRTMWNANLRREFGITIEQWEVMYEKQNGLCAICGQPETARHRNGKPQRLAVDHCHKSMRNRGLLCAKCNHALERVENIPDWGAKALGYLQQLS